MAVVADIKWRGTEEEQQAARTVYELMSARGTFYADEVPIRQRIDRLADFIASQNVLKTSKGKGDVPALVESALKANPQVFGLEESDDGIIAITTKAGVAPNQVTVQTGVIHSFKSRLFTGAREPTEEDLEAVRGVSKEIPDIIMGLEQTEALAPETGAEFEVPIEEQILEQPEAEEVPVEEQEEAAASELELEPEVASNAPALISIGDQVIDLSAGVDAVVANYRPLFMERLGAYLDEDFRFVRFGDEYYIEDKIERLSKGQLRDIKDYINERNEPLSDEEILSDALRRPLQDADYSLWRFTINYRLLRERKDFRFVGTADDRLWATSTLPPIGESLRKPSEIAQDYRYLTDPELTHEDPVSPASGEDASGKLQLTHVLTWYESENGVLPVGRSAELLMPPPLLEDQQQVMLRIQDPQNFATYLAELRLGANNRGTYIAGLEELFQSTLVPGASFTLVQGEASNEFTIEYETRPAQEARLLQFDPRKERWFFAPVVYQCPVDESFLLTEERVGALNGKKRASDSERKKPDLLLERAFEVVGEAGDDGSLTALVDDLFPVVNIERPFSRAYILSTINSPQYPQFSVEDESLGLVAFRK